MRSLFTISWREVTEGFSRFILTMLSVALGVAFLTGTLTLRDSLQRTFDDIIGLSSRADVYVVGTKITENLGSTIRRSLPLDYEYKIRRAVGPNAVIEPTIVSTNASLEDAQGKVISNAGAPTVVQPYYDDPKWETLTEGRWAKGPREIVVDADMLKPTGLNVGDTTNLILEGGKRQVTITGAIDFEHSAFGAVQVYMERDAIETLVLPTKKVPSFEIYLEPGTSRAQAITAIAKEIPADAIVMTKERFTDDRFTALETGLGFVSTFLLVFVFLSIFIGSFVIANTFAMVVRQRMKQFAMLRAIGAHPRTIFGLVLVQAVVIGIIGSILGILFGMGLVVGIQVLFTAIGLEIPLNAMTPTTMVYGLITGMVVTVAGALLSARTAALTDPLEVLREAGGAKEQGTTKWNWAFAVLTILGAIIAYVGAVQLDSTIVGYGAVLVLIGVLGALRILATPVVHMAVKPFMRVWPVQSRMAVGNIVRNPKRTASTAGALTIGVALVIAGAMLSASLKGGSSQVVENNLKSDLVVYTGNGSLVPKAEADKIPTVDGVKETSPMYLVNAQIQRDREDTSGIVTFVSDRLTEFRTHTEKDGNTSALTDGDIIINELRGERGVYAVGDELTITTPLGAKTGKVGLIVDAPALFSEVVLPDNWASELLGEAASPIAVDIKVEDDADIETVRRDINNAFVENALYKAATKDEIGGEDSSQIDLILGILYALLALSVVTAIFGIINTLALSVMERVREIGMVRAVGMSRKGVMGMITLESVLMTIFGVIVGLAVGIGLAWALVESLSNLGISKVIIPWLPMVGLVLGALVVGVLAAVVPARQAAKINELQAMAE